MPLSDGEVYLWVAIGVASAIVFPVLRNTVAEHWPSTADDGKTVPDWVKKYGSLLGFSLLTALIIVAFMNSQDVEVDEWWVAFLGGFAWESAVEKLGAKSSPTF